MKILILQHVEHEHPGYITDYAREKGIELKIVELWKPYILPEIFGYSAIIIMGGPMGAYEEYASRDDEVEFIKNNIGKVPMMGFCLGSQLIAHSLGAKVYPNIIGSKKIKEVGYFDIKLTKIGKSSQIFAGFPQNFESLEWHGDIFDLPDGAELLASSRQVKNQAFVYKNAYGFLFHFEFTSKMVTNQLKIDKDWIHEDNELDEKKLQIQATKKSQTMKQQCYQLLDNFLKA